MDNNELVLKLAQLKADSADIRSELGALDGLSKTIGEEIDKIRAELRDIQSIIDGNSRLGLKGVRENLSDINNRLGSIEELLEKLNISTRLSDIEAFLLPIQDAVKSVNFIKTVVGAIGVTNVIAIIIFFFGS